MKKTGYGYLAWLLMLLLLTGCSGSGARATAQQSAAESTEQEAAAREVSAQESAREASAREASAQSASSGGLAEKESTPEADAPAAESEAAADRTEDAAPAAQPEEAGQPEPEPEPQPQAQEDAEPKTPAPDFVLTDQYGVSHSLADYRGSVIFLNFWATWCPPCRAEMPDIQKLYEEYAAAGDSSVVILGVAAPGYANEQSLDGVKSFLSENGYTYPVLMDETGEQFLNYYVFSYPTTYMIDRDGNVFGYVTGSMSEEVMRSIIAQTLSGQRAP